MQYFAYGSNMSLPRLLARTPSATRLQVARLSRHQLRFHKAGRDGSAKCDAFYTGQAAHHVIGVVFTITAMEIPALDLAEGLGQGYEKKRVLLDTGNHSRLQAFTYYATAIDNSLKPFDWYVQHVLHGCNDNALPSAYVQCIRNTDWIADPDPARSQRELSIYR